VAAGGSSSSSNTQYAPAQQHPDGGSATIDAIATDTSLGPLKGKVTGTHQGRNIAVRSLTGIGSVAAMALGQSNANGAFSEADMIRMQTASNIGRAGDEEVMRLNMTEHPIVTLPAGLRIYVVFEKASRSRSPNGLTGRVSQDLEAPTGAAQHRTKSAKSHQQKVWVQRDGKLVAIAVTVGLDDDSFAEIKSGNLKPGDQVVVSVAAAGTSGTAKTARTPALHL